MATEVRLLMVVTVMLSVCLAVLICWLWPAAERWLDRLLDRLVGDLGEIDPGGGTS